MSFIAKLSIDSHKLNWALLVLSLLLTLTMAVMLGVLSGASRESYQRTASTFFTDDDGMRAAYLAMRQFTPARRWRSVLMALPPPSAAAPAADVSEQPSPAAYSSDQERWEYVDTLILAAPSQPLTPSEAEALLSWMEEGGQAILCLASDWPVNSFQSRFGGQDQDPEGTDSERSDPNGFLRRLGITIRAAGEPVEDLSGDLGGEGIGSDEGGQAAASAASPLLELEPAAMVWGEGLRVIVDGPRGPVAAWKNIGRGRVAVITDPWAFSNSRLRSTSNEVWLIQTAAAWGGGRTVFDEIHHGFVQQRRLVSLLAAFAATPWGWMCLQILLVLVAYLLIFRSRFGSLREPSAPGGSSPLEWIDARAGLLQAADSGYLCAHWMHRSLALRLSRSLGYSVDIDEERVQRKLGRGEHPRASRFREYLRLWRKLSPQRTVSSHELESLARAAGLLSQELKSGNRP